MPRLSKKDEKRIQRFAKIIQQNKEYTNYISTCLQPLVSDISRMEQYNLNLSFVILGDPFFDFDIMRNILQTSSQTLIAELDIDKSLLTNNNPREYFNILQKQIKNRELRMNELPKPLGYQGPPFLVINRYTPEFPINLQNTRSDIKQMANLFDEIGLLLFSPDFRKFGIVWVLPEKIEDEYKKTFHEWERFRKIRIGNETKYRVEVCREMVNDFSERERVPFLKNIDKEELTSIVFQAFDSYGFNPIRFLNKLKERSRATLPKKVTKKDLKFFKEIISILNSKEKTRYVKLKSLVQQLKDTNFDARNILIDLTQNEMEAIEKSYDTELREKCINASLNLKGEYPNYSIYIPEYGVQIEIEVKTPYGNVYVDGRALENKFPGGVVEKVKAKIDTLKKLKPTPILDHELIEIFVGYIRMYSAINKEIIDINEFLREVLNFLNSKGIYPISPDKRQRDMNYLKSKFAGKTVIDALKKYVTFETGKITEERGIQLEGLGDKLYTIMKLQRRKRQW